MRCDRFNVPACARVSVITVHDISPFCCVCDCLLTPPVSVTSLCNGTVSVRPSVCPSVDSRVSCRPKRHGHRYRSISSSGAHRLSTDICRRRRSAVQAASYDVIRGTRVDAGLFYLALYKVVLTTTISLYFKISLWLRSPINTCVYIQR